MKKQTGIYPARLFPNNKMLKTVNRITNSTFKLPEPVKSGAGFTLIELLVVISIIGLLASVVLVALNGARAKARDSKRVADMNQLAKAMELYFNDNNSYPTGTVSVGASGGLLGAANTLTNPVPLVGTKYVVSIPSAPIPQDGSCGAASGRGNNNYWYDAASNGSRYTITFCLGENTGGGGGIQSGVRRLTPGGIQ